MSLCTLRFETPLVNTVARKIKRRKCRGFTIEPLEPRVLLSAVVVARQIFYNHSAFDGNDPAANALDDNAIASDKQALLPGQTAGFANYTSYSRGINGIMVDVQGLAGTPTLADFTFKVGNDDNPAAWATAPAPAGILIRPFAGADTSDRIEIIWADGAIRNEWLQVTIDADTNTGLASPDVFYFGNLIGSSGQPPVNGAFQVTAADENVVAANPHGFLDPSQLLNPDDYNRDGRVDATDTLIARYNLTATSQAALQVITPPGAVQVATHVPPALVGNFQQAISPNLVIATPAAAHAVFYVGQPVVFALTPGAATYEVRDYYGDMVDSGGVVGPTLTLNVTQPGWYKLYLYGSLSNTTFGDSVGGTMFSIFRSNPNFPSMANTPVSDPSGSTDEVARDAIGMGPQRFEADASNPIASIAALAPQIAYDSQYYTPLDPQRGRALLVAFGNGTVGELAGVSQIVQQFQNQVEYWEPQNEPEFTYSNGADFVPVMRDFYNTVKSVNPNLKVLGPGIGSINPAGGSLQWIQQFLAAGGGQYIDGFSFHFYNGLNGDLAMGRQVLTGLKNLLAQYGLANIPLWQTEQGYFAAEYGVYDPVHEARWTMLEEMLFEQYGIPKEHNVLWYDVSHGFLNFPAWWENGDGSLNPAATLMRVWAEELYGTNFQSAYDFGSANNLYIGSLFSGPGKTVAAFMTAGSGDATENIQLSVSSGSSIHVISPFGVASDLPVVNGQVTLPLSTLPIYVELAPGQNLGGTAQNWGPDLALQAGTTVATTASAADNVYAPQIVNGQFENWYYLQASGVFPFWDDTPAGQPDWVQITLPTAQWVNRVVIYCSAPWQIWGTLMAYSLQYNDNGTWVTLQNVQVNPKTFAVYTPTTLSTLDTFWGEQSQFLNVFATVYTSQIRVLVEQGSYGGGATALVAQAGGQANTSPSPTFQEIAIYGPTSTAVAAAPQSTSASFVPAPSSALADLQSASAVTPPSATDPASSAPIPRTDDSKEDPSLHRRHHWRQWSHSDR